MSTETTPLFNRETAAEDFRKLGLKAGDTVLVQSGFKNFKAIEGGPRALIEALLLALGPEGTLIMPTFNFSDFGEKKLYSKKNTRPQTGLLTEIFSEWEGHTRVYHPIHGFALVGKRAQDWAKKIHNQSSFEDASLFGELYRTNAKIMLLGVSYRVGFSFFHYIEEMVGVPYRTFVTLTGKVEELDGSIHDISVPYYGRKTSDILYDFDKVIPCLEAARDDLIKIRTIGTGQVRLMEARPVFDVLAEALRANPNLILK